MIYGVGDASTVDFPASKHPLYWRWVNMLGRCYYPKNSQYSYYGAKGIYVEPYLMNFANYVDFVSKLENYNNLLCDPELWQIDKDEKGGECYSRSTLRIIKAEKNLKIENTPKQRAVLQIDKSGREIARYSSIVEAQKSTGISKGNISKSARTGCKAGGYNWRFCNDSV